MLACFTNNILKSQLYFTNSILTVEQELVVMVEGTILYQAVMVWYLFNCSIIITRFDLMLSSQVIMNKMLHHMPVGEWNVRCDVFVYS